MPATAIIDEDDGRFNGLSQAEPEVSALRASIPSAVLIEELLGHIGAAKMQLTDADDKYIAAHIHAAHALASALFKGIHA